jgi:Baseplate J-like protein
MKTQIIALETHDDLISVRDRMSWAKSPRILLVWPKFEKVTLRPVDLRILQQHAHFLGADLGVVTRRANVRRDAQGFGIPVFDSSAAAQRDTWPPHRPSHRHAARNVYPELLAQRDEVRVTEASWRSKPATRVGFFALGVVAVLLVTAIFIPRAVIKLTPITQLQSITIPVTASTSIQSVLITGSLPAHEIAITVTGNQSARISSQSSIPQDQARGIARFKNLTQEALTIPAGTIVYSSGPNPVGFATQNDTHLPGNVNAVVEVPITALQAGAGGNVPANSLSTIDGSVSLSASVTNPAPITGGTDRITTAPSEDDHQRVRSVLTGLLLTQAQKQINDSIGAGNVLLVNTLKMGQASEETYDPPSGQAGDLLKLTMSVPVNAQYLTADDLKQLAESTLDASEPEDFIPVTHTLAYKLVGTPTVDDSGASHFTLQVERTSVHQIDMNQANALARGLALKTASRVLMANLPLTKAPEIDLSPSWWPWLPLIPFRITVQ